MIVSLRVSRLQVHGPYFPFNRYLNAVVTAFRLQEREGATV